MILSTVCIIVGITSVYVYCKMVVLVTARDGSNVKYVVPFLHRLETMVSSRLGNHLYFGNHSLFLVLLKA